MQRERGKPLAVRGVAPSAWQKDWKPHRARWNKGEFAHWHPALGPGGLRRRTLNLLNTICMSSSSKMTN